MPTGQQRRPNGESRPADVAQLASGFWRCSKWTAKRWWPSTRPCTPPTRAIGWPPLRVQLRENKAATTIWSFAATKALAVAINPIVVADVLGGTAVDAVDGRHAGRVYGIQIRRPNARSS